MQVTINGRRFTVNSASDSHIDLTGSRGAMWSLVKNRKTGRWFLVGARIREPLKSIDGIAL